MPYDNFSKYNSNLKIIQTQPRVTPPPNGIAMFKKKDRDRKTVKDEPSDDESIIELTDEVEIQPEETHKAPSSKTGDLGLPKADIDPSIGDDENIIVFEENEKSSLEEDPFTEEDEIDFFADDDEGIEDDEVIAMPSELSPTFGEDGEEIDMLPGSEFEREEGAEIKPGTTSDNDDNETDDDIIEILEFDRHYPDDDDVLENTGILDPSVPEEEDFLEFSDDLEEGPQEEVEMEDEDFLDLFDVDEESPEQKEEIRELSESEEKAVEDEMRRFFDDAFDDKSDIENDTELTVEGLSELDPNLDRTMAAAALSSGSDKLDRPDSPIPHDPTNKTEAASLPKDQSKKDERMQKVSPAINTTDAPVDSAEQIDQAIERIINEKFAGRIEHIIYEIIEKAVKREIDRLKESLLEDSPPEDSSPEDDF